MKQKIINTLFAVCLTAGLVVSALPTTVLDVKAAVDISDTVESGLNIQESEINQLLTGDLILPTEVTGLAGATITYSVGNANPKYVSVDGNTLKVTRPYAGEGDYRFTLSATVTAEDSSYTKAFPLTIREGLSDDSYAGYLYVCFSDVLNPANPGSTNDWVDVQQVHFFLSQDGMNWTALNGCNPAFTAGSDYLNDIESCGPNSVNYKVADGVDIEQTTSGDASVLFPFEGEDQGIRDPYLIRGSRADGSDSNKIWILATDLNTHAEKYGAATNKANNICGNWGLTATVGVGSTNLFIYETEDFVHWTRRYVDVGSEIGAAMAWAPEAIYNPEKDNYLVYWSARVDADGSSRDRLYCNETTDFVHFGPTRLYEQEEYYVKYINNQSAVKGSNDGYGNIDTSQLWVAEKDADGNVTNPYGTLYRLVKDETNKQVYLMGAKTVLDPEKDYEGTLPLTITPYELDGTTYSSKADLSNLKNDSNQLKRAEIVYEWFKNQSVGNHFTAIAQPSMLNNSYLEGATMFKFIDRDEWCIMVDNYGDMSIRYEPYLTTDLSAEGSVKKAERGTYGRTGNDVGCHGGMIPITVKEYNTLIDTYNADTTVSNYHQIDYISVDTRIVDDTAKTLTAAADTNVYSDSVKAQMKQLAARAADLSEDASVSSEDVDLYIARANKLLASKLLGVPELTADSVILDETSLTLCTKATEGLSTKATLQADASIDSESSKITWSSSKPSVATVTDKGVVTAKAAGTATITATAPGGAKATCKVTVKGVPSKITLNKKSKSLKKGKTFQLKVTIPKGTVCSTFKYKSNKTKIASVSKTGKITAKKKGTAKITVTAGNNSKAKATITIKVK